MNTPRELTVNFIDDYISQRERGTTLRDCHLAIDNFLTQLEECYKPKSATPLEPIDERELADIVWKQHAPMTMRQCDDIAHAIASRFGVSKKLEPIDEKELEKAIKDFFYPKDKPVMALDLEVIKELTHYISDKFGVSNKLEPLDREVDIEIVGGCEGSCLVINNYRVCGSKPWGGGKVKYSWKSVSIKEIIKSWSKFGSPTKKDI
jgi:hypothetical protein